MSAIEKSFVMKRVCTGVMSTENEDWTVEDEKHCNLTWSLYTKMEQSQHCFELNCTNYNSEDNDDFSVTVDLELRATFGEKLVLFGPTRHTFKGSINEGWPARIAQPLPDESLTIELRVKILDVRGVEGMKSRYDGSMSKYSDVVLVVDGEKFHVSKGFLASCSSFFDALLFGDFKESTQTEVVLNGIEVDEFQDFLDILYQKTAVSDENAESLLRVADMYDVKCVLNGVEKFLMKESEKSPKEKLKLSAKYHLANLKKKYLSKIKTVEDIRAVLPDDLTQMDAGLVVELFKKSLALH